MLAIPTVSYEPVGQETYSALPTTTAWEIRNATRAPYSRAVHRRA
jgi:hypothetical protein